MECLKNLVGLKGCGLPVPSSGLYVNSLEGISLELSDKIASSEQGNFIGVWNDVVDNSIDLLKEEVLVSLSEKTDFKQVLYHTQSPRMDSVSIPASNELRGAFIKLPIHKLASLYIKHVWLWSDTVGTISLYARDMLSNTDEVLKEDYSLISGLNKIPIDTELLNVYRQTEYFIYYVGTGIATRQFKGDSLYFYDNDCQPCCHPKQEYDIIPATFDTSLQVNENYASGIWLDAEIRCSLQALLCENKVNFASPFRYLLAAKLLDQKLASYRTNVFSSSNKEYTKESRDRFYSQFKASLKKVISSMPTEGLCFTCEQNYTVKTGFLGV